MWTLVKARYQRTGFKTRICFFLVPTLALVLIFASEYFRVDMSSIHSVHRAFSGKSSQSGFDWDGWVKKMKFMSIGDVYNTCDRASENRIKVGKATLSYDDRRGRIMATLIANFTLVDDMVEAQANIYAKYHGRVLYNETYDVCNDLAEDVKALECPKRKGDVISIYESKAFPSRMPKGYFIAVGHVYNQNNKCLALVEAEFEI